MDRDERQPTALRGDRPGSGPSDPGSWRDERDDYRPAQDHRGELHSGSDGTGGRHEALDKANRFCGDVEEDLSIVMSYLPLQDDRNRLRDQVRKAFDDIRQGMKIRHVFPVGRRCGHCLVTFEDQKSRNLALAMRMVDICQHSAKIHPMEKPYLMRLNELPAKHTADRAASEVKESFGIQGVHPVTGLREHCYFRVEDTKDFVRLLAVDGFPLKTGRLFSVSYHGSQLFLDCGQGRRSVLSSDGNQHSNELPHVESRHAASESGHCNGGKPSDGDQPVESNASMGQGPGYTREPDAKRSGWVVRLKELPEGFSVNQVLEFLNMSGIFDVGVHVVDATTCDILGRKNSDDVRRSVLALKELDLFDNRSTRIKFIYVPSQSVKCVAVEITPKEATEKLLPPPKEPVVEVGGEEIISNKSNHPPHTPSSARDGQEEDGMEEASKKAKVSSSADPSMPGVIEKFRGVKDFIKITDDCEPEEENRFLQFCEETLRPELCKEHVVDDSSEEDTDMVIPVVWTGGLKIGGSTTAKADAHYVWRDDADFESVRRDIGKFPEEIHILRRIPKVHPGYSHMLKDDANVFFVRPNLKEYEELMKKPSDQRTDTSRSKILGIIKYLHEKKRVGLVHLPGQEKEKNVALVMSPELEIMELLNIPWRFQQLIGHDSLLVVFGEKVRKADVKKWDPSKDGYQREKISNEYLEFISSERYDDPTSPRRRRAY